MNTIEQLVMLARVAGRASGAECAQFRGLVIERGDLRRRRLPTPAWRWVQGVSQRARMRPPDAPPAIVIAAYWSGYDERAGGAS